MVKGYSEHDRSHSKRDAKKTANTFRKQGYGARVVPKTITAAYTGKKVTIYVVLRSDRKLRR